MGGTQAPVYKQRVELTHRLPTCALRTLDIAPEVGWAGPGAYLPHPHQQRALSQGLALTSPGALGSGTPSGANSRACVEPEGEHTRGYSTFQRLSTAWACLDLEAVTSWAPPREPELQPWMGPQAAPGPAED